MLGRFVTEMLHLDPAAVDCIHFFFSLVVSGLSGLLLPEICFFPWLIPGNSEPQQRLSWSHRYYYQLDLACSPAQRPPIFHRLCHRLSVHPLHLCSACHPEQMSCRPLDCCIIRSQYDAHTGSPRTCGEGELGLPRNITLPSPKGLLWLQHRGKAAPKPQSWKH